MPAIEHDSLSANPKDVERKLHLAVAGIICQDRVHLERTLRFPCPDCIKLVKPLIPPLAGALLVAGYRPPSNYDLAGAAVFHLLEKTPLARMVDDTEEADEELLEPEG